MNTKINKYAARQAFNDTVEMTARLAAFSTSRTRSIIGNTYIKGLATELAHRDLLLLCLATRRVVELANLQTLAESECVQVCVPSKLTNFTSKRIMTESDRDKISLWDLIGIVVHHLDIRFYTTDTELNLLFDDEEIGAYEIYQSLIAGKAIDVQCSVKSDKSSLVLFDVSSFLKSVSKIVEVAEHEFSDLEIYVRNYNFEN